eukprot:CAMPEP_0184856530 /NCGR_PEP_ID=MMETSP0580-20130426/1728_1 /TAXON_ID=1118495 /ORGANISM="Dactyliosolen fragilissimus" /LENGTH=511 /DNA_ID=CAMNT_0027351619 /DNA_START=793 /DNA_END=2328 /DNA_ORIENTATION=-
MSGGEKIEKYIASYLPTNLIRARMFSSAGEILTDKDFISRRVTTLGTVEASRVQVEDLLDLRRELQRSQGNDMQSFATNSSREFMPTSPERSKTSVTSQSVPIGNGTVKSYFTNKNLAAEINDVHREASRLVLDEIYRMVDISTNSTNSLNLAICLSTVGEGLLKARLARDAKIRLEEAVGIYTGLLGPNHIDVARALNSVAKSHVKMNEKKIGLIKFDDAGCIFQACNANRHYDSIANQQTIAGLLVELGEWSKAKNKFEHVISLKKAVHGLYSLPVAKILNDYAVVLAKNGHMDESLRQYEEARIIYEALSSPGNSKNLSLCTSLEIQGSSEKLSLDITLIDLNIGSIKSKKGDYLNALLSYEKGVSGLRSHLEKDQQNEMDGMEAAKIVAQRRHLVSAIGRIGSLKMKLKDNAGALEAYLIMIKEVDDHSPTSSKMEKAKAHVKCATIYRQMGKKKENRKAVHHLKSALQMYTQLHGLNHKDTKAIASSLQQWEDQDGVTYSSFDDSE